MMLLKIVHGIRIEVMLVSRFLLQRRYISCWNSFFLMPLNVKMDLTSHHINRWISARVINIASISSKKVFHPMSLVQSKKYSAIVPISCDLDTACFAQIPPASTVVRIKNQSSGGMMRRGRHGCRQVSRNQPLGSILGRCSRSPMPSVLWFVAPQQIDETSPSSIKALYDSWSLLREFLLN